MSQHDEHRGHSTASVWGDHWTSGWVCLRCLVIMLITISSQMAKCKPRCKETDSFVRRKKHVLIPFDGKRENDWFLNFFISGRPNTCNPPSPHVRVCPVFATPPGGSAGRPWWKPPNALSFISWDPAPPKYFIGRDPRYLENCHSRIEHLAGISAIKAATGDPRYFKNRVPAG